jgi:hypothetical protein
MAEAMEDLWPDDLGTLEEPPPVTFLREQATLLGRKMQNIVEATIVTDFEDRFVANNSAAVRKFVTEEQLKDSDYVVHRFMLNAPALSDYRYLLFRVYHRVAHFYPLAIDHEGQLLKAASQKELTECLRRIFSAESTRKVIGSLKAQSTT